MPDDYDEKYKSWSLDSLPIAPESWQSKVRQKSAKQYKIIEGLVKKASTVYISTDYDREGEAIARSLLDRFRYSGPVRRVCLTALDESSIRKALSNIKDGQDTVPLYYAALGRQRADWLIGMNVSRLYTVLARQVGFESTLHVGRVITPTVALVCQRDRDIAGFTPSPYWVLGVNVAVQNGQFLAQWVPPEECSDDQGRCTNKPMPSKSPPRSMGLKPSSVRRRQNPVKSRLPCHLTSPPYSSTAANDGAIPLSRCSTQPNLCTKRTKPLPIHEPTAGIYRRARRRTSPTSSRRSYCPIKGSPGWWPGLTHIAKARVVQ